MDAMRKCNVTVKKKKKIYSCHQYLKFVFLSVNDDRSDLLVHEDEDGTEKSRDHCYDTSPPRVWTHRVNKPTSVISCWLYEHKHSH